jgi:hypothetical protein
MTTTTNVTSAYMRDLRRARRRRNMAVARQLVVAFAGVLVSAVLVVAGIGYLG